MMRKAKNYSALILIVLLITVFSCKDNKSNKNSNEEHKCTKCETQLDKCKTKLKKRKKKIQRIDQRSLDKSGESVGIENSKIENGIAYLDLRVLKGTKKNMVKVVSQVNNLITLRIKSGNIACNEKTTTIKYQVHLAQDSDEITVESFIECKGGFTEKHKTSLVLGTDGSLLTDEK
ncbi:hypothetical protein [Algibacter sp. PT7-4]|uniref:hypothetical protein n=1 Tax=Algibacter ulvanivorans TaxID=3400999 RepID=UPI003AB03911